MKKLQNLMPVSVFVKAFCKVMKTLVEDEVVVNDVMLQLSTEMALTHKEVPRVLFLKGREEDTCIVPNEIAWIGAEGSYVCFHMANGRRVLMSGSLHSVLSQLYEGGIDYFVRIHYSHAVNLYHIKARSGNILFVGKDGLPVSNKYRKSFSNYCLVITKRV